MNFARDGAAHFPAAFTAGETERLRAFFASHPRSARLHPGSGVAPLIAPADAIARTLRPGARPAFARYFDKTEDENWSLSWHQDRTIAVAARIPTEGFSAWTVKHGIHHAVPPFHLLATMIVLRIHLDDVGADQAPLLIAPGSHRLGLVSEPAIAEAVESCGIHACLAGAGDVWAYSAPILHASGPMKGRGRRRVLQLAYSADDLPGGLEWLGV